MRPSRRASAAARSLGSWTRWVVTSSGVSRSVAFAEHPEHAAGGDGAVLGGVADQPQRRPGGGGHPHELVEVAVGQGRGLVDHEHGAGVEGVGLGVVVGEVPGDRLALDPGGRRRACGRPRPSPPCRPPGSRLPATRRRRRRRWWSCRRRLGRWRLGSGARCVHHDETRARCSSVRCECVSSAAASVLVGDEVGALVQALGEPRDDPVLDAEHLDGREQRVSSPPSDWTTWSERGTRRSAPRAGRRRQERLGSASATGDGVVGERDEGVGAGEHRPSGADAVGCGERREHGPRRRALDGSTCGRTGRDGRVVETERLRRVAATRRRASATGVCFLAGRVRSTMCSISPGCAPRPISSSSSRRASSISVRRVENSPRTESSMPSISQPPLRPGRHRTPRLGRELVAHLGGGERGGGVGVAVEAAGVERPVAAVGEGDGVGDDVVVVGERVERPGGEVPERRNHPALGLDGLARRPAP